MPEDVRLCVRGPIAADDPRVVALVRESFLDPPSSLPYNLSGSLNIAKEKSAGSWSFINDHVQKLFGGHRGGFFVEAGALDGERVSNTLFLEQHLGWKGLLVEPVKENYMDLLSKHRRAWTSNTCLSPEPFPKELVLVSLHRKKNSPGLREASHYLHLSASYLLGLNVESDPLRVIKYSKKSDETYSKRQCFPLVSYLLALNVLTIDFLSLDIEGAEKAVLRHIPWQTLNIRSIVVENVNHGIYDTEFVEWMGKIGYILLAQKNVDYIFVKENDPVSLKFGTTPILDVG